MDSRRYVESYERTRSTTTKKGAGEECTACPGCVRCDTGGSVTVKPGYARQPDNSAADEASKSRLRPTHAQQISMFQGSIIWGGQE